MKYYIVHTQWGKFETCATSPRKAIAKIRFRLVGRGRCDTSHWKVAEVA